MANEILVGLKIGAVTAASVASSLGGTRRLLAGLNTTTRGLETSQRRLGRTMSTELARGGRALAQQRAHYDRLGQSIRRVKAAQKSLADATARSTALQEKNRKGWSDMAKAAVGAWAAVKTGMVTAGKAAVFEDTMRNLRIEGNLSGGEEAALGKGVRGAVAGTNQDRGALAAGSRGLLAGGAGVDEVVSELNMMGNVMTGLRTNAETTSGAMITLRDMGARDATTMQRGLDKLVAIGQQGLFTPDMMIHAFADLGATIKQSGLHGEKATAELAASLQIAGSAMGGDDAKAGLQSWMSVMSDRRTADAYEAAGVDYRKSMAQMQAAGMDQFEASLEIAGGYIRDNLSKKDKQALLKGDDDGRVMHMLQQMGMGEVFRDANAARFALTVNNNRDAYKKMSATDGAGAVDATADLRKQAAIEQLKSLRLSVDELATDVGAILLPPLVSVANALKPVVAGVRDFAQANPTLTQGILLAAGGLVGLKTGMTALSFGFSFFVRTPLAQLRTRLSQVQAIWSILSARSAMAGSVLGRVGSVFGRVSGFVKRLASVAGGKLVRALMTVGRVVLFVGRALIMNPIGLIVMAIAGAAYLVYKYWEPIKGFFSRLWDGVKTVFSGAWSALKGGVSNIWESIKTAFDGGIAGIGKLILDWSPLGLFYKAFAGVMDYFGVELPGSFSEFGGMLVSGLIDGITNVGSAVKNAIVGLGDSVVGWFRDKLKINSPSKIFMELGGGVPEGAALGITKREGLVREAALDMAEATRVTLASPRWQDTLDAARLPPPAPRDLPAAPGARAADGAGAPGSAMVVHFSPTIKIDGGAGDVGDQVKRALQSSYAEFETNMRRYLERAGRIGYGVMPRSAA